MNDQEIKEKLEAIWPEVIGAVVTKRDDTVNLCPINYQAVSTVYEKPLSVCLGLDNKNHTLETILQAGEFVYAYRLNLSSRMSYIVEQSAAVMVIS